MTTVPAAPPTAHAPAQPHERDTRRIGHDRAKDAATVAVPAVLALILCLYGITARSIGFDEAASIAIASQHGSALGSAIAHDGGNMSGYYLLLHLVISLFGDGLAVVRAPSAVATAATVALVGAMGLRLSDRRVAVIAGLLTAVSLPLVFWGQSARGYAPMVALAAGSFVAFLALVDASAGRAPEVVGGLVAGRRGRAVWIPWVAYLLCTTLAVYAGFVAILIVPAQLLALAGRRRALPRVGSALAVAVLGWIPLVVLAASRGSGQLFWVPRPSLRSGKQVLEALTSAGMEPSFHPSLITTALMFMTVALIGSVVVASVRRRLEWPRAVLLCWLLVPVGVAWLESMLAQPIFIARNLLVVLPAAGLLPALVLSHPLVPRSTAWVALAVLLALRAVPVAAGYGVSPEDWKSASAYVLAHTAPGDCLAFYPADARMAFGYYVQTGAGAPRPVLPAGAWGTRRPYVEDYAPLSGAARRRLPSQCRRLWLVSSHAGQPDGPPAARANLARFHELRAALQAEYSEQRSRTFGYAATITVELLSRPSGSPA